MAAPRGGDREHTCAGMTKAGKPCTSFVKDGAEYCHWHRDQADDRPVAPVVSISKALADGVSHLSTREERLQFLDDVWQGHIGEEKVNPTGEGTIKTPASTKDRLQALQMMERMLSGEDGSLEEKLERKIEDVVRGILG